MSNLPPVHPDQLMGEDEKQNANAAISESLDQRMAFEYYYSLGDERTHEKVASRLNLHLKTIQRWSSTYRWTDRIKKRQAQVLEHLHEQANVEKEAERRKEHIRLIDGTIARWSKRLLDGQIQLSSVSDLSALMKLRWMLMNLPNTVTNNPNEHFSNISGSSATVDLKLQNMSEDEVKQYILSTSRAMEKLLSRSKNKKNMQINLRIDASNTEPAAKDIEGVFRELDDEG